MFLLCLHLQLFVNNIKHFIFSVTSSDDKDSLDSKRILDDLHLQVKELEEKRAKIQPIINLVDNMVKLGSLYRGPSDAPLSHRIRNLPSSVNNSNINSASTNSTPNPVSQELKDEIQVCILKSHSKNDNSKPKSRLS